MDKKFAAQMDKMEERLEATLVALEQGKLQYQKANSVANLVKVQIAQKYLRNSVENAIAQSYKLSPAREIAV